MSGYIKDHRKELDSDIWLMPPLYHRTWQWLKYNVNHTDNEIPMRDGTKMLIKRGQRLTSVRDIAKGISWYEGKKYKEPNPKTVSAILEWMIKTNMILINRGQGNREYTLITLIKYEEYQKIESQGNSKVTPDGEGREQRADINKNDNNVLNVNKEIFSSSITAHSPFGLYEKAGFGKVNSVSTEMIGDLIDTYTQDWTMRAMREAIKQGGDKLTLAYVDGILKRWKATNHLEPWTLEREQPSVKTFKSYRGGGGSSNKPKVPINQNVSSGTTDEEFEKALAIAKLLDDRRKKA